MRKSTKRIVATLLSACEAARQRLIDNRDPETIGVWDPDGDIIEQLDAAIAVTHGTTSRKAEREQPYG